MGTEENDFGFYGEEAEEIVVNEVKGITDTVTDFTYTNLCYPCIIFKENFKCAKHQMNVVSNMVKSTSVSKDISLYFQSKGEIYKMGMLSGFQVDSFLEIIGTDNVIGFYEENKKLESDRLYVLCTF